VIVVSENITGSGFPPGAHPQVPESTLTDALKVPQMNSLPIVLKGDATRNQA